MRHLHILLVLAYVIVNIKFYRATARREFEYRRKLAFGWIVPKKIDQTENVEAAKTIQRAWRRYVARRDTRKRIARLEEVLGMTIPSWQCRKVFETDEESFKRRRALIPAFAERTEKTTDDERARVTVSS